MCLGKMLDAEKNKGEFQPYLANINVRWGGFDFTNLNKMRFEKSEQDRYGLKYGDIVVCEGGEPGRCAIWKEQVPGMKIQKALHRVRVHRSYSNEFIYYRMLLAGKNGELGKHFIGSTIKHLTGIGLKQVEFSCPPFEEQQKIAAVLSALDAKIDCNNRINAELEAMAKTLYDYWFVQFDFPDANGKPYKSSGGRMVYNATLKREIPAGWEAATLSQFIEFERGVTYGKEDVCTADTQDSIGILRATNVTGNVVDANDLVFVPTSKVSSAQTLKKYETLIVMSSGSKEHVGKNGIYYFDEPRGFGAFCSKITASSSHRFFVNTFLQSPWFKVHIKNSCLGTNIKNLTNDHINDCPIANPDGITSKLFEGKISSCYEKIANNTKENQQLAQLRDWLLPLLMNGQVTVA